MLVSCRQWRQVASAWNPESASKPQVPIQIRKQYIHLLLAFETQLTEGAPSRSITKEAKQPKAAKPAVAAKSDGPLPAPKVGLPPVDVRAHPASAVLSLPKPAASQIVSLLAECAGF